MQFRVHNLSIHFTTRGGDVTAVDDVSFAVGEGETLGLVGESGSGKSATGLAILGLLSGNGRATGWAGWDVGPGDAPTPPALPQGKARRDMAMVFQYPRLALDPIRKVGDQLVDVLAANKSSSRKELRAEALALLDEVRIARAKERMAAYPFELSGGMCQRVLIAMALAKQPRLLIGDEPTTGLDVVTQKHVMALISEVQRARKMATILVTHDLGLAAEHCDRIVVMRLGKIVEQNVSSALFEAPRHSYSQALIAATPGLSTNLDGFRAVLQAAETP